MFIPYSTDAPIYHFPAATIGLIVLNIGLFFAVPGEYVYPQSQLGNGGAEAAANLEIAYPDHTLALQRGAGLQPWQWVTNSFLHANLVQLIFNLIFLWSFGLVVEGKVGPLVFLLLYVGIAILHSAIEQTLFCFWGSGASLGASAAIYGILGIALVWAPQNEFEVAWLFVRFGGSFSIPILMFAFIRFAFDFIGVAFTGFFGSDAIQLIGLALGIAAGFVWLRRDWVDCEGWDLISVWQGKEGKREEKDDLDDEASALVRESNRRLKEKNESSKRKKKSASGAEKIVSPPIPKAEQASASSTVKPEEDIESLILDGHTDTAVKLFESHKRTGVKLDLKQAVLFEVIKGLLAEEKYDAALPCMEEHVKRFKHGQVALLLNMAKVYLHLELPRKAQRPLKSLQSLDMNDQEHELWKELVKNSKQQIKDGAVEFSD